VPALSLFESTLYARTYQPVDTSDGLSVGIDWIHHVEETAVRNLNAAARSDFARVAFDLRRLAAVRRNDLEVASATDHLRRPRRADLASGTLRSLGPGRLARWEALRSLTSSKPRLTFGEVTLFFLSCFGPTEALGRLSAA
jgi:hypothetical protein